MQTSRDDLLSMYTHVYLPSHVTAREIAGPALDSATDSLWAATTVTMMCLEVVGEP